MPMKYDPDTGQAYFVPDVALELDEGVTPQPDTITSKHSVFAGDGNKTGRVVPPGYEKHRAEVEPGPDSVPAKHIPIEREFDSDDLKAALDKAKPGHLDYRVATDQEIAEVEQLAAAHSVLHWPVLIAIINRLREAEAKLATR